MSTATVTTSDGRIITSKDDDGDNVTTVAPAAPHGTVGLSASDHGFNVGIQSNKPLDGASFIAGLLLGALLYFIIQSALRWHARREVRSSARAAAIGPRRDDGMAAAVAALSRRTATLETIVTDPAHRTAREIDALR